MSPVIAPLILSQQIGLLYRNVRMGQLISVINASLLAWVASGVLGMQALLVWWLLAAWSLASLSWLLWPRQAQTQPA